MIIELKHVKPKYMSELEISSSDIFMQQKICFDKGKKYLVIAKSGHGKTSLLNFIYPVNLSFDGEINYTNCRTNNKIFDLRINRISYLSQEFRLFPELSLIENIELKNKLTNHKTIEEINALIDQIGLSDKKHCLLKTFSFGQKQRVAIIRALCQPFDFILLDEPFSHLDNINIKLLTKIINQEIELRNAGLIITSLEKVNYFKFDEILNL